MFGSFLQIGIYIPLAIFLSRFIGLTGIALADTIAFTTQAFFLLVLLNRRYPGVLKISQTVIRVGAGTLICAGVAALVMLLPMPVLIKSGLSLLVGGLVALPFIWPELKLLIKL